jgi:hypothetical protein
MMSELDTIFEVLRKLKVGDFVHKRSLPDDAIAAVDKLVDIFGDSDEETRHQIAKKVDFSVSFVFFTYAGMLAVKSVRDQKPSLLRRGLIALAVENDTFDWRDTFFPLVKIYHSARKFPQINPDKLFLSVAEISCQPFRETLLAFINRSEAAKSLEAFGIRESAPPAPFDYEAVQGGAN